MDGTSPVRLVRYLENRFPGCYGAVDGLRKGKSWPGVTEVAELLSRRYGLNMSSAAYYAPALCACAVWICYKRIYQFQEPLARSLCCADGGDLPLSFPSDPLRYLPLPGFYIQAPDCICAGIQGLFCWLQEGSSEAPILNLLFLQEDGFIPGSVLLKPGATLSQCLPEPEPLLYPLLIAAVSSQEGAAKVVLQQLPVIGPYPNLIHNLTVRGVQLLLYLVSSNADIDSQEDENGAVQVGRQAAEGLQSGTRRSHIRQGHWHKYWYGPKNGERRLVPKWIPPVIIGKGRELASSLKIDTIE